MSTMKIEGLSKSYGKIQVLKDIDLQIDTGLFVLLGPNGAGKWSVYKGNYSDYRRFGFVRPKIV